MVDFVPLIKDVRARAAWFRRERPWDRDEPEILDAWANELEAISKHFNKAGGE